VNLNGNYISVFEDLTNNNIMYSIKFTLVGTALLVGS